MIASLTSAFSEADLRKMQRLAAQTSVNRHPFPDFQIMVETEHLETPSAAVEEEIEVWDIKIKKRFLVLTQLISPLMGWFSYKETAHFTDMHHGVINFPFFSMHFKQAKNSYCNIKQPLLNPRNILIQP